jgi:hypothetical protein
MHGLSWCTAHDPWRSLCGDGLPRNRRQPMFLGSISHLNYTVSCAAAPGVLLCLPFNAWQRIISGNTYRRSGAGL